MKRSWASLAGVAMAVGAGAATVGLSSTTSAEDRRVPLPPRATAPHLVTIDPSALKDWEMLCAHAGCIELALTQCANARGKADATIYSGGGGTVKCNFPKVA